MSQDVGIKLITCLTRYKNENDFLNREKRSY